MCSDGARQWRHIPTLAQAVDATRRETRSDRCRQCRLAQEEFAAFEIKLRVEAAQMPSIVRLAFRAEQIPFAIDVQFIQRHLECPPDQIALGRSDRRAADLCQGEYGGVNGLKRQVAAEDGGWAVTNASADATSTWGAKALSSFLPAGETLRRRQRWRFHLIAPFEGEARRETAILLPAASWLAFAATRLTQSSLDQ